MFPFLWVPLGFPLMPSSHYGMCCTNTCTVTKIGLIKWQCLCYEHINNTRNYVRRGTLISCIIFTCAAHNKTLPNNFNLSGKERLPADEEDDENMPGLLSPCNPVSFVPRLPFSPHDNGASPSLSDKSNIRVSDADHHGQCKHESPINKSTNHLLVCRTFHITDVALLDFWSWWAMYCQFCWAWF